MGIQLHELDLHAGMVRVHGKGSRDRDLPLGNKTVLALDRYLRARSRHRQADLPWLWLGLKGRFTAEGLRRMLRERGKLIVRQLRHPARLGCAARPPDRQAGAGADPG